MKNKVTTYHCTSRTDATDKANLYYINVNAAHGMKKDPQNKQIQITNRHNTVIAIFAY